jgi:hypothetical protein
MQEVGQIILGVLTTDPTEADLERLLKRSRALTTAFPLYPSLGE